MPSTPIKVFLVEDSPVALTILQRVLTNASEITIVGTAKNGMVALEKIPHLKPDVVCTDLLMGKMDGLELTKQLLAIYPVPILVISEVVTDNDTKKIGQLMEAGVLDVFPKPKTGFIQDYEKQQQALVQKIKLLSGVKVFSKKNKSLATPQFTENISSQIEFNSPGAFQQEYKIITIGVSTGGPKALQNILGNLPSNFPLPIVCIQHISEGFLNSLIDWLTTETLLKIKIAQPGELPLPGTVYFAPEKYHLELDNKRRFVYSDTPPINNHRPSITTTFSSIAQFYKQEAIGILLTGMGKDGALGMEKIYQTGGLTIAQDEATSVIFGMPKEAIDLGVVKQVLPLFKIAAVLKELVGYNQTKI
ncbi:MAG TPA: chemotaxis-specific protein-glutamate methyltransferase CheB [Xenococcaceae cyanobacterium]